MSANQRYKNSGTKKSFKEWLKDEQMKGLLEVHEGGDDFVNADGDSVKVSKSSISKATKFGMIAIGLGIAGIGIYNLTKKVKND